jgi:hypothetical protein
MALADYIKGVALIESSAASGSQSVTVPAGTNYAVLFTNGLDYNSTPPSLTATLGGQSLSLIQAGNDWGWIDATQIFGVVTSGTGSQTFAWTWPGAADEGYVMPLIFLSDIDTSDPVTGSAAEPNDSGNTTTSSFSSSDTDIVLLGASSYDNTVPNLAVDGQTEIAATEGNANYCSAICAYKAGSDSGITVTANGISYGEVAGVSLKISSGGSTNPCSVAGQSPAGSWVASAGQVNPVAAAFESAYGSWFSNPAIQNAVTASFVSAAGSWSLSVALQNAITAAFSSAGSLWSGTAGQRNQATVAGSSPASNWFLDPELQNPASVASQSAASQWVALAFTGNICTISVESAPGVWALDAVQNNPASVEVEGAGSNWVTSLSGRNAAGVEFSSGGSTWQASVDLQNPVSVACDSPAGVWISNLLQQNGINVAGNSAGSDWSASIDLNNPSTVVWGSAGSQWIIVATGPGLNICTIAGTSAPSVWASIIEQQNSVSVSFVSQASGFTVSIDLQNQVTISAQSPASLWDIITELNNLCVVSAQSPASLWTAVLSEAAVNMCMLIAESSGSVWSANALQNNIVSVSFDSAASEFKIYTQIDQTNGTKYERQILMAQTKIANRGKLVTWIQIVEETSDPSKPWDKTQTRFEYPVSLVFFPFNLETKKTFQRMTGMEITEGHFYALMGRTIFLPKLKDKIEFDDKVISLVKFNSLEPDGTPILYTLEFER